MSIKEPPKKKFVQYLENSQEIEKKLKWLFDTDARKVAVVGFVGGNATEYIRNFKNLEIYCWPLPHATNPEGVVALMEQGASVYFKERLHAKIYWAEGRGVIIGSANLSDNALGEKGLLEYAVYINDVNFKIDELITSMGSCSKANAERLNDLRNGSRKPIYTNQNSLSKQKGKSFKSYMESEYKEPIKLLYYYQNYSKEEKNNIKQAVGSFKECNDCGRSIEEGDLCLQIYLDDKGRLKKVKDPISWFVVNEIIEYDGSVAVQKETTGSTPFRINKEFKSAFEKVFNSNGLAKVKSSRTSVIKEEFFRKVLKRMESSPHF